MIPCRQQSINESDINSVVSVLRSNYLTQGPIINKFEDKLAKYCSAKHAVAVNSGTSALHVACASLGLKKGDYLWTSPITFVASSNCALYCGAKVDFVDIDLNTFTMCPNLLEKKLINAKYKGKLPKIVIPVHLSGQSCDMEAISFLSKKYKFKIIEDASHCIGAKYKDKLIGNCKFSDITVFSFHPVKIITTGEGGMAVTNRKDLADKMIKLRNSGITRDVNQMTHKPDGPWYYQQTDLGYNYRMSDIHAALGISQLKKANEFVKRRNVLANQYHKQLFDLSIDFQDISEDTYSARHLYIIRVSAKYHLKIFRKLINEGLAVNLHYIPVHFQPYYKKMGFKKNQFPNSEQYYKEAISLPIFPDMTNKQQLHIIKKLTKIILQTNKMNKGK